MGQEISRSTGGMASSIFGGVQRGNWANGLAGAEGTQAELSRPVFREFGFIGALESVVSAERARVGSEFVERRFKSSNLRASAACSTVGLWFSSSFRTWSDFLRSPLAAKAS